MGVGTEAEGVAGGGPFAGYADPGERPPLLAYAILAAVFNGGYAGALLAARRAGRELPERVPPGDLVLIGVAAHKVSRLLAKDKITSFLRAPFTRYQGPGGPKELEERARGTGARRVIGELLACPYCLGLWVVAALHVGMVGAPRATRLVASTFTGLTIADFLQIAYKAAEERGLGGS